MKKTKTKNLVVILSSCTLIFASIALFARPNKGSVTSSDSSINDKIEGQVGLNNKNVKFKNNGDTFVLSAIVNEDATIKSVRFVSDGPDCVSVTRKTENSVTLTRLKSFNGIVKITATSDDPFSNFQETCNVRCYNAITSFDDAFSAIEKDGDYTDYFDCDEIYLLTNKTTRVQLNISTEFGENEEVFHDGTFTNIEDADLNSIKEQIETIFAPNQIINFTQKDNVLCDNNAIYFDVVYKIDLFEGQNSIDEQITINDKSITLKIKKYIPVTGMDFSCDSTIVL